MATNLTNSRDVGERLPASLRIEGVIIGDGKFQVVTRLNPLAAPVEFDLNAQVEGVNLVALNDFLEAYAHVDVKSGTTSIYFEIKASDGSVTGYVKPLLENLDIVDLKRDKDLVKLAWEAIVAAFVNIFKNQPNDRLGTKIPFSGSIENPDVGVWGTILNLLRNAFVQALPRQLEGTVNPQPIEPKTN